MLASGGTYSQNPSRVAFGVSSGSLQRPNIMSAKNTLILEGFPPSPSVKTLAGAIPYLTGSAFDDPDDASTDSPSEGFMSSDMEVDQELNEMEKENADKNLPPRIANILRIEPSGTPPQLEVEDIMDRTCENSTLSASSCLHC